MSLLDKSIELYLAVKSAKPMNDPMFLQIKDYIVNHFGHDGTRAISAADEKPIEFLYKQGGSNRRQLRAFEHPLNANKRPASAPMVSSQPMPGNLGGDGDNLAMIYQKQYDDVCSEIAGLKPTERTSQKANQLLFEAVSIRVKLNILNGTHGAKTGSTLAVKQGNVNQSNELAERAAKAAAKSAGKPNSPAPSQIPTTPDVAAGDVTPGGITQTPETVEIDVETVKKMKAKALGELYPPEAMRFWLDKMGVEMTGKESRTQLAALILLYVKQKSE